MPFGRKWAWRIECDDDDTFHIFSEYSEFAVAVSLYREAASTKMVWKNANLRIELTRLLRRAGVSGWPRLLHSMRASRQTELQHEFPLPVVYSCLGNSPRVAQQSYLLVTEDCFERATVAITRATDVTMLALYSLKNAQPNGKLFHSVSSIAK